MPRKIKLSYCDVTSLRLGYEDGKSISRLARDFKLSRATIRDIVLKRNAYAPAPKDKPVIPRAYGGGRKPKLTEFEIDFIREHVGKWSERQMACVLNVSQRTVANVIHGRGSYKEIL